ncbi:MAG: hypothetical protein ACKO7W_25020 [Elainella sp.]
MSWSQRIFLSMGSTSSSSAVSSSQSRPDSVRDQAQLNRATVSAAIVSEPRLHLAQIPLEYVGVNGEYDPQGLAKRVALAFDQHPELHDLKTLCILQQGSRISLLGKVATGLLLQKVVACVRQVEGVQAVDVSQVNIEQTASPVALAEAV